LLRLGRSVCSVWFGCGVLFENSTGCLDGQRVGWLVGSGVCRGWLVGLFLTVFSLRRIGC
jgi:hypothetical protein